MFLTVARITILRHKTNWKCISLSVALNRYSRGTEWSYSLHVYVWYTRPTHKHIHMHAFNTYILLDLSCSKPPGNCRGPCFLSSKFCLAIFKAGFALPRLYLGELENNEGFDSLFVLLFHKHFLSFRSAGRQNWEAAMKRFHRAHIHSAFLLPVEGEKFLQVTIDHFRMCSCWVSSVKCMREWMGEK